MQAWNVKQEEAQLEAQFDTPNWTAEELALLTREQVVGLVFLYAKGCASTHSSGARKGLFKDAVGIVPPDATAAVRAAIEGKAKRLFDHLLSRTGDATFRDVPDAWHSFDKLCGTAGLEAWGSAATSTVFFRDVVAGCEVQRVQKSGLSFMHGPNVVLHYAVAKSAGAAGYT